MVDEVVPPARLKVCRDHKAFITLIADCELLEGGSSPVQYLYNSISHELVKLPIDKAA